MEPSVPDKRYVADLAMYSCMVNSWMSVEDWQKKGARNSEWPWRDFVVMKSWSGGVYMVTRTWNSDREDANLTMVCDLHSWTCTTFYNCSNIFHIMEDLCPWQPAIFLIFEDFQVKIFCCFFPIFLYFSNFINVSLNKDSVRNSTINFDL